MKSNILITGTSTGVGLESAILFAKNGFKVYATMRNLAKSDVLREAIEKESLDIDILELDVTKLDTIDNAVNTIIEKDGKIDILLNNAGAGFAKTTEQTTVEEIKWVTETNYHGVLYCTKAVLPHMREAKAGRIITVTSVGGLVGQPFNEFYCGAKFAVEGYMEALASYITPFFDIKFSLIEPGGITTEFMNSAVGKTMVDGQLASGPYLPVFEKYLSGVQQRANEGVSLYQHPKEVGEVILEVAQEENPPFRKRTSEWAEEFTKLKTEADHTGDLQIQKVQQGFL